MAKEISPGQSGPANARQGKFRLFLEHVARTRPLAENYYQGNPAMRWDTWRMHRLLFAQLRRIRSLNPGVVLDLGCGIGVYELGLKELFPHSRIVALDLSEHNLAAAARTAPGADYALADGEELPLKEASVDLAISVETFEHLLEPSRAETELRRVLKPGGLALIAVPLTPPIPMVETVSRLVTALIGSQVVEDGGFKEHMRIYDVKSLKAQFSRGWDFLGLMRFNLVTLLLSLVEKLSPRAAEALARRHQTRLDSWDLALGRLIYAKGLMTLRRSGGS